MDLANFDLTPMANDGATLTVRNPITGEVMTYGEDKKPVTILLLGAESDTFREATKAQARRQFKNNSKTIDLDAAMSSAAMVLAEVTVAWEGIQENGVDLKFSKDEAIRVYTKYSWLRQQVDAFVAERENFYKA